MNGDVNGDAQEVHDRAPAAVLFVSILVLAALAGGIAYLLLSGDDRYPAAWDDRVAPLAQWTAQERGLDFEHPVKVNFLTDSEYTAATTAEPTGDEADELADVTAEMRALGLISGDLDLAGSMNTLNDSGTLAFYSPTTEQVYVRGQELTPSLRVTIVHELVHVLQDQHFDLTRTETLENGRGSVLRAIAEGDAGRIEAIYVEEELTAAEREAYDAGAADETEAVDDIREEVPDALTAVFAAPYAFGEPLVYYLVQVEGEAAVDDALRNPPSEEVLLNPRLWGMPEAEEIDVDVVAPGGTTEIRSDFFGPIAWFLVLSSRMEPGAALDAVDGFGGDRYVSYRDGERVCVRATVVGDDDEATATLEDALRRWVEGGAPEAGSVERDDDSNLRFQACDPGTDHEAAGSLQLEALALPVTRTAVYMEVRGIASAEEVAWCVAGGLVGQLTLADLVNPNLAQERDLSAMMIETTAACSG